MPRLTGPSLISTLLSSLLLVADHTLAFWGGNDGADSSSSDAVVEFGDDVRMDLLVDDFDASVIFFYDGTPGSQRVHKL